MNSSNTANVEQVYTRIQQPLEPCMSQTISSFTDSRPAQLRNKLSLFLHVVSIKLLKCVQNIHNQS